MLQFHYTKVFSDIDMGCIQVSLSQNYCGDYPFKPLTAEDIYSELAESRDCYAKGEYEDFEDALDEISTRYGL